jgi:hypothetical protein
MGNNKGGQKRGERHIEGDREVELEREIDSHRSSLREWGEGRETASDIVEGRRGLGLGLGSGEEGRGGRAGGNQ